MRSRFNHDGSIDPHAHHEHEVMRRAEEALERRRLQEHATKGRRNSSFSALTSFSGSPQFAAKAEAKPQKLPHEEHLLAALKPPSPTSAEHRTELAGAPGSEL